jgi:hypothetical protein
MMSGSSSTARKQPLRNRSCLASPAALLAGLQGAHRQIEAAIVEAEAMMAEGQPDPALSSALRMRISQANLARTRIAREVCSHLISTISISEADAVRSLQRRDAEQFQQTSELVREWTPKAVEVDWEGYCDASRQVRDQIRSIVAAEKWLFYPLLERAC